MSNRNVNCNKPYLKIWRARFLSSKRWYSTVRFITGVIYLLRLQISELREIVCVCVRVFSCVCTIRVLCDDRGVCLTNIPVNFWNCGYTYVYCRILENHCCSGSHLPSLRVVKTVPMDSSPRLASAEECSEYTKYHSRQQTSSDCFILLLQQVGRGKDPYDINHQPASGYV